MKNPFLSDRNIFSKVVNPLKKKSETENKSSNAGENPPKTNNTSNKEPFISTTPLMRPNEMSQEPPRFQPQPKMTFGKPEQLENRLSFNKNTRNGGDFQRGQVLPKESLKSNDYEYESFKIPENPSGKYMKNNYKSISLQENQIQFKSPSQDDQFQQYRKVNNFKDYSPIGSKPEKKINDSQFLNIDALGDDLNRFLAESKNQEELCQLLGIVKKSQNNRLPEERPQPQKGSDKLRQKEYFNQKDIPQIRQSEDVPSAFAKQKGRNYESEPFEPSRPVQKDIQKRVQDRQYIPTFNYMGLEHQSETISREQDTVPRFNQVSKNQPREERQISQQNMVVFDYSRVENNQGEKDVQQLIAQQMSALCMNGKYRTFLTSSEKIVTVRYKLKPL